MSLLQRMRPEQGWRVETKLLALTLPLIVAVTGLAAWAVQARNVANLQEKLTQRARSLHTQIMADRKYYTSVILPRAIELGGSVGADYKQVHGRFPLPATFVREVSELTAIVREGYAANLISPWAINPDKGVKDQFQRDAFAYLMEYPTGQFVRIDTVEGQAVMRVLMGDRVSVQSCADCHNAHPKSPRHDFKLNDLMGGLEIVIPMDQYLNESRRDLVLTVVGGAGLCLLVIGIVVLGTRRTVTRPLVRLSEKMRAFAGSGEGRVAQADAVPSGDEVTRLEETFETMGETIAYQENELRDANEHLEQRVVERTQALQTSEARFRSVAQSAHDAIISADSRGNILSWNTGARTIFGYAEDEVLGLPLTLLMPVRYREAHARGLERMRTTGESHIIGKTVELHGLRKDGSEFPLELSLSTWRTGEDIFYSGIVRDITERKQFEAQLRQAQKMEAVGQLTSGIAHDFNNLLTVIIGASQLALDGLDPADPLAGKLEAVKKAGERAAALTRQLLAFSRKQILELKVLDLNAVVANMDQMLRRLIEEDIELRTILGPGLWPVKVDPSQIEQVLLNLALNARDAMPRGGKLTIETANVELDEAYATRHLQVAPGPYVMLAVSDTGCGMDAETQARIFEPFFTTKEQGKGTGLGLSTVYGIVKQSGGYIWVYSEPGRGTTFKIYLTRVEEAVEALELQPGAPERLQGSETVLLVEDEEMVRQLAATVLQANGYTVLAARDGREALDIAERHQGRIHLLMTDVVMPGMSGRELAERLRSVHPSMRVLYMSGYTDNAIVHHGVLKPGTVFLQKPFLPEALARKVRQVLDA